jgi:S1-C subfamily serine protease
MIRHRMRGPRLLAVAALVAALLLALQQQFVKVVNQVGPSVVLVQTSQGLGSGVVFDANGNVVTNNHVVQGASGFQVIGIPTLAAADSQLGGAAAGIGFAIPSNIVRDIASQLTSQGNVTNSDRAYLGVEVAATTSGGLVVTKVEAGGPAARAGIRAGELVTAVDGTATTDPATVADVLAGLQPGQAVGVEVARPDGAKRAVRVTLGQFLG